MNAPKGAATAQHRRAECTSSGERYMGGLCLIDFDFPCVEPCLEDVKMVLEVLRSDNWIGMDRKQSRIVRKGDNGGVICCGKIGSEDQIEQGS